MALSNRMRLIFVILNIVLFVFNTVFMTACIVFFKKAVSYKAKEPPKNHNEGDTVQPAALSSDGQMTNLEQIIGGKVADERKRSYLMPEFIYQNKTIYQERKPKAHMVGVKPDKKELNGTDSTELIHMKTWRHDCDTGYLIGDFNFQDGFLGIETPGMYYVYHGVSYIEHLQCNVTSAERKQYVLPTCGEIRHGIYKIKNGDQNETHETLATGCSTKKYTPDSEYGEYNDYVGELVSLNAGDKVFVKVNNIGAISWNSRANSFGAFLVKSI